MAGLKQGAEVKGGVSIIQANQSARQANQSVTQAHPPPLTPHSCFGPSRAAQRGGEGGQLKMVSLKKGEGPEW